jgi:hypothetical protein
VWVLDIRGVIGRRDVEDASFLHQPVSIPQVISRQGATAVSLDDCVIDPRKEDSAVSEVTDLSEQAAAVTVWPAVKCSTSVQIRKIVEVCWL